MKRGTRIFIFLGFLILIIPFTSAENVSICRELNQSNTIYTLTQNILNHAGTCFTITADNIILDGNGFTIDGDDDAIDHGIDAGNRDNITIQNFDSIRDFYRAINAPSTDNSLITNNTVFSNTYGFIFPSASNNIISNNIINSDADAIDLRLSGSNNQIINNTLYSNSKGIIFAQSTTNNTITNNTIYSNSYGIFLQTSFNNIITNNVMYSNTNGIYLSRFSENNQLLNNQITNSGSQDIFDSTGNSFTNYLIYNNSFGEIKWNDNGTGSFLGDLDLVGNIGLGVNLTIGNNTVYLNAGAFTLGNINSSANITLYGMDSFGFTNPLIFRNGVDCGIDCSNFTHLDAATVKFNVTYAGANYSIGSLDSDNDGVEDSLDICPNTELPETFELLPNHFGDVDGDGVFEKLIVEKKNEREVVNSEFNLEDTSGCSCNQILEIKPGKNIGESINGCTKGTIIAFSKHNFSGGILTRFSFVVTGFWALF